MGLSRQKNYFTQEQALSLKQALFNPKYLRYLGSLCRKLYVFSLWDDKILLQTSINEMT